MKMKNYLKVMFVSLLFVGTISQVSAQAALPSIGGHKFIVVKHTSNGDSYLTGTTVKPFTLESLEDESAFCTLKEVDNHVNSDRYFVFHFENNKHYLTSGGRFLPDAKRDEALRMKKGEHGYNEYVHPQSDRELFYVKIKVNENGTVQLGNIKGVEYKLYIVRYN